MTLAKPGDPFIKPNGEVVIKKSAFPEAKSVLIGPPLARNHVSKTSRNIKDLPTDPKTQTAIAVVLFFSLFGLTDNEISHLTGVEVSDIQSLKHHSAYQETFEIIFGEILNSNSESMQAKIGAFAPEALSQVMSLARDSKYDTVRYRASVDLLDRSGLSPDTLFGRNGNDGFDSLKIVIEDGDEKRTNIEVDFGRTAKR